MRKRKYVIEDFDETLSYYLCGRRKSGFGVEIAWRRGPVSQRRASGLVFLRKATAEHFLRSLYLGRVYPVHLTEIVSDLYFDKKEKIR